MATKKRLERLTKAQEEALERWRREWFEIGSSCEPADRQTAEAALIAAYAEIAEKPPHFMWVGSPATASLLIHLIEKDKKLLLESLEKALVDSLRDSLWASLRDSLWASLGASLWDSLRASLRDSLRDSLVDSLWASLGASLRDSLRASLWASLGASLRDSLRASLWASLGDSLGDSLRDSLGASLWASLGDSLRDSLGASLGDSPVTPQYAWHVGQMDSYWVAFYRFCKAVIGVRYDKKRSAQLAIHERICRSCGWWYPYKNLCIVCERPAEIHWNRAERPVLHRDGGPAVLMRDGWPVYVLNGVRVPEWLAVTKDAQIDPKRIAEIENADVRREFLRKVGIERLAQALGAKSIDKESFTNDTGRHEYELLALDLGDNRAWRYLRMENPSLRGTYHLEGVPNDCESVRAALLFRNGMTEKQVDEKNGADWFQQGDVILRPKGAKKFKLFPKVLT